MRHETVVPRLSPNSQEDEAFSEPAINELAPPLPAGDATPLPPLLTTKLYMPAPRPDLVPRARLAQRLTDGLTLNHRLLLISAPAGSGKTTLLVKWLSNADTEQDPYATPHHPSRERPPCWLSLTEDDNDAARFFTYLIASLRTAYADIGADALSLLQAPQLPPIKAILTVLLNDLAATMAADPPHSRLLLVLDDYHVIETPAIHDAIIFLLDHLPPHAHIVIATRTDPPFPLPRLRTRNQLTEIRVQDLRFTPEETTMFLNQTMGLNLTPADITALEARTEGWIASLQLAALSLRGRSPAYIADFITAFSGSHRHIIDYLVEEVLMQQSPEIRDFLLRTSILDRLTAPLCDALVEQRDKGTRRQRDEAQYTVSSSPPHPVTPSHSHIFANSQEILEYLERANLFIIPLDNERHWYRYHRLFADFLRAALNPYGTEQVNNLHHRAAAWYATHEMVPEAIGHSLKAQNFTWAARLIRDIAVDILKRSEAGTLLHWLQALPDEIVQADANLCIFYAESLLIVGEYTHVDMYLRAAKDGAERAPSPEEQRSILSQIAAIQAYTATYRGDFRRGVEMAQQAFVDLPGDNSFLRSFVTWLLGFNLFFDTDIVAAQRAFDETLKLSQSTGNTLISALSIFISGYLYNLQGHLHQAQTFFEQGLKLFESTSWLTENAEPAPSISLVYQGLGEVLREVNELEAAERALTRSIMFAQQWGNAEILLDSYTVLARIRQGYGNTTGAQQAIAQAIALVDANKVSPLSARQAESHQARLWINQGNVAAAAAWAAHWERYHANIPLIGAGNIALFVQWLECVALALLDITQHNFDTALTRVASLHQKTKRSGWWGITIELWILESMAYYGKDQISDALTVFTRALTLAAPEGYVRIFLDKGELIIALLREAQARGIMPDYVNMLLHSQSTTLPRPPAPQLPSSPATFSLTETLSDRELEVLHLIVAGDTNREIADKLFIAISTVKTHINNIYGKLGVSNRVQAVTRANELEILSWA
ncbi:MAG: hypothetical protein JXA33_18060 [Anaerolineae bacterium]|nr:hypothetical protein [Anaerolineae bacterium]